MRCRQHGASRAAAVFVAAAAVLLSPCPPLARALSIRSRDSVASGVGKPDACSCCGGDDAGETTLRFRGRGRLKSKDDPDAAGPDAAQEELVNASLSAQGGPPPGTHGIRRCCQCPQGALRRSSVDMASGMFGASPGPAPGPAPAPEPPPPVDVEVLTVDVPFSRRVRHDPKKLAAEIAQMLGVTRDRISVDLPEEPPKPNATDASEPSPAATAALLRFGAAPGAAPGPAPEPAPAPAPAPPPPPPPPPLFYVELLTRDPCTIRKLRRYPEYYAEEVATVLRMPPRLMVVEPPEVADESAAPSCPDAAATPPSLLERRGRGSVGRSLRRASHLGRAAGGVAPGAVAPGGVAPGQAESAIFADVARVDASWVAAPAPALAFAPSPQAWPLALRAFGTLELRFRFEGVVFSGPAYNLTLDSWLNNTLVTELTQIVEFRLQMYDGMQGNSTNSSNSTGWSNATGFINATGSSNSSNSSNSTNSSFFGVASSTQMSLRTVGQMKFVTVSVPAGREKEVSRVLVETSDRFCSALEGGIASATGGPAKVELVSVIGSGAGAQSWIGAKFLLQGIDYAGLSGNSTLMNQTMTTIWRVLTADPLFVEVGVIDDLMISVQPGSVKVNVWIPVPAGMEDALTNGLLMKSSGLLAAISASIQRIPGISLVTTGTISTLLLSPSRLISPAPAPAPAPAPNASSAFMAPAPAPAPTLPPEINRAWVAVWRIGLEREEYERFAELLVKTVNTPHGSLDRLFPLTLARFPGVGLVKPEPNSLHIGPKKVAGDLKGHLVTEARKMQQSAWEEISYSRAIHKELQEMERRIGVSVHAMADATTMFAMPFAEVAPPNLDGKSLHGPWDVHGPIRDEGMGL